MSKKKKKGETETERRETRKFGGRKCAALLVKGIVYCMAEIQTGTTS